jgi:hypothetical protein
MECGGVLGFSKIGVFLMFTAINDAVPCVTASYGPDFN